MHCNPNDRLSKQEQKQPPEAAKKPRGDRDDEGFLKFGDHPQAKDKDKEVEQKTDDSKNIETRAEEFDHPAGV